jgi:hypothetical protein
LGCCARYRRTAESRDELAAVHSITSAPLRILSTYPAATWCTAHWARPLSSRHPVQHHKREDVDRANRDREGSDLPLVQAHDRPRSILRPDTRGRAIPQSGGDRGSKIMAPVHRRQVAILFRCRGALRPDQRSLIYRRAARRAGVENIWVKAIFSRRHATSSPKWRRNWASLGLGASSLAGGSLAFLRSAVGNWTWGQGPRWPVAPWVTCQL